jgi:hypothetical protein
MARAVGAAHAHPALPALRATLGQEPA